MAATAIAIGVIGSIIILGALLLKLSERTRFSGVIPLLLLGILLGPISGIFDPVQYGAAIETLVVFALIVVLFDVGYSTRWTKLKKELLPSTLLTSTAVVFSVILIFLAAHYILHLDWTLSLLLAALLASTDLTIVSPALKAMKLPEQLSGLLEWEGTFNSVAAAVLAIVAVDALTVAQVSLTGAIQTFLASIFVGVGIGIVLGYFLMKVIEHLAIEEKPHIITIGAVLLVYAITEIFGASGVISAFVVGLLFGNFSKDMPKIVKSFGGELELILITFVYVVLGTLFRFDIILMTALISTLFILLVVVSRAAAIWTFTLRVPDIKVKKLLFLAGPRGIVTAVLTLSYARFFPDPQMIVALVFATILVTTIISSTMPVFVKPFRGFKNIDFPG